MRVVAGIDVGNATTEVVLADPASTPPTPLVWDRAPTRGRKGSPAALTAAVELLERLERRHGLRADVVVVTPQRPVDTRTAVLAEPAPDTGASIDSAKSNPCGAGTTFENGRCVLSDAGEPLPIPGPGPGDDPAGCNCAMLTVH